MATAILTNKVPTKLSTGKDVMFAGSVGLFFGFGTSTPTEWYKADNVGEHYTVSSVFGDVWVKYDLDVKDCPTNKTVKYQVEV